MLRLRGAGAGRAGELCRCHEVSGWRRADGWGAGAAGAGAAGGGGPLVLVWDNLNTHVSRAMRELVTARSWLTVYQLPAYASELNPVESVWSHLKRSLVNLVRRDIAQLTALTKTRLRRMQYQSGLLDGFLAGTRLDLTPLCNPNS